jgi:hypothetical protein
MDEYRFKLRLLDVPAEYSFLIDRKQDPPVMHIPGDHRGPDLCFPRKPEQEEWLNGLSELMAPFWHCQWKFTSIQSCEEFLEMLAATESGD